VMFGYKYGVNRVVRQSKLVQREFVYFPGTNFNRYDTLNYDSYAVATLPLTRRHLLWAMQHFKGFFEKLLGGEGVLNAHRGAKIVLGRSSKKAELKIYYPKVDETVLPAPIGYTRRNYEEGLELAFEDPLLGYGVDPGQVPTVIERHISKKRPYFPEEDIEEALERARKRQRPDEAAALLLKRNGGNVEAAAQMLAKLRFY
jgi:hypothetical protein